MPIGTRLAMTPRRLRQELTLRPQTRSPDDTILLTIAELLFECLELVGVERHSDDALQCKSSVLRRACWTPCAAASTAVNELHSSRPSAHFLLSCRVHVRSLFSGVVELRGGVRHPKIREIHFFSIFLFPFFRHSDIAKWDICSSPPYIFC